MSKWMTVLALAATMVFVSYTNAADAPKKAHGPHGKVTKIEKETADPKITDITITSGHGDKAKETVIKVDDSAKITKGDATTAATLADVTVGVSISITQDDGGKTTAIVINPPHTKKPK